MRGAIRWGAALLAVVFFENALVGIPSSVGAQLEWLGGEGSHLVTPLLALGAGLVLGLVAVGPERVRRWWDALEEEWSGRSPSGGPSPSSTATAGPPQVVEVDWPGDERPMMVVARDERQAVLVDKFPVTKGDYARYARLAGTAAPAFGDPSLADHPVVGVTFRDAAAYAEWAGKRLPTVAEWRWAVEGDTNREYPWGNEETPAKANVSENGLGGTTPVATYRSGVSPVGVWDLCGNVWEWCADETDGGRRALMGSAFTSPLAEGGGRVNDAAESMKDDDTGFRCAVEVTAEELGEMTASTAQGGGDPRGSRIVRLDRL